METKEIIEQLRELAEHHWRDNFHCYEMLLAAADRLEAKEQSPNIPNPNPYTQLW